MPNEDDELFTDEGLAALAEQIACLRRTGEEFTRHWERQQRGDQ